MRCLLSVLIGLMFSVGFAGQVCADADGDEARDQFQRGKELYAEGKFVEAATAFQRAYTLKPSYKILYNIGQAENENGEYVRAHDAYFKYLEEGGDEVEAGRRQEVEKELKRLETLIGYVVVEGAPEGAVLLIDGRRSAEAPFADPTPAKLGDRKIVVKHASKELFNEIVRIAGGENYVVSIELSDGPPGPGSSSFATGTSSGEPAPPHYVEGPSNGLKIAGIVTMAVGGAIAVGAGVTGGLAIKKESELDEDNGCADGNCPPDKKSDLDSARGVAMASTVLTIAAGAVIATGVVLTIVGAKKEREKEAARMNLSAAAGADGGVIMLGGRF